MYECMTKSLVGKLHKDEYGIVLYCAAGFLVSDLIWSEPGIQLEGGK